MIVTNTETIAGYHIVEIKGLVQGNTVRAKHAGRDIAAGFKNLVGGELKGYTELFDRIASASGGTYAGTSPAIGCQRHRQRPFYHERSHRRSCRTLRVWYGSRRAIGISMNTCMTAHL